LRQAKSLLESQATTVATELAQTRAQLQAEAAGREQAESALAKS
jgi:hypothetical protein